MKTLVRFLVAASLIATATGQQRRPMTTDDVLNAVALGDVQMSPDGEWVLFSKSELDWEKNKRKKTFHLVSSQGGESFQYLGESGGSDPEFSPNGRFLAFKREVDKKNQLFYLRTAGGEAVQLTKHDTPVQSFKWAPDSATIYFLADDYPGKEAEKKKKDGDDAIFVEEGPNGQERAEWRNLWSVDLKSGKETQITRDSFRIGDFDVAPEGKRILFAARRENRRNQGNLSEIYRLDLEAGKTVQLTENLAPESDLSWSPDGEWFAYLAADDRVWELRNAKIWLMKADASEHRRLSANFEGRIQSYKWSPDGRSILLNGLQRTNRNVFRLDVASGAVAPITNEEGTIQVGSFSQDGKNMAFLWSDLDTPADVYVSSTEVFEPKRLTEANPWIEKELLLASGRVVRWKSRDGLEIEGLLYLPAGYEEGTRIPLILHIHGGPAGVFDNEFQGSYHVWAGLGYASLAPNVRGSSGYSDELLRGNMFDIGGGDYEDLMSGVDFVVEQGWADPDRLGVRGWSYGGILGGWTITRTDRFKAASVGAMVSDWTSEYGPGFNHDVRLWYIGKTPWENPEGYRQKSPLTHAVNITTPTLILHGLEDTTDTEPQSMMFYTALKDQGKTVRYIRFPRERHGFREPRHQRTRDVEEIRWMQKHVRGIEWAPWERPEKEKPEEKAKEADPVEG